MCSPMAHFVCRMVMALSVFIALTLQSYCGYTQMISSLLVFSSGKKQPIKTLCFNGLRIVLELV